MKAFKRNPISLIFIFSSLLFLSFVNKTDADDPVIDKIIKQINKFNDQYEQQKIYIQTDKDIYLTGETIWLKAYLVNALSFKADTISKEIYVELLDQSQRVAGSIILRNKKGVSDGYLLLSDTLIGGNYQLRAYTSWMRNFDRDYFFFKTVRIKNPGYADIVTRSRLKTITGFNASVRKKENDLRVTFFPEGGDLVNGLVSRIAFKAENSLGMPQDIKGEIVDDQGKTLGSFESVHDGMGTFMFLPRTDRKYMAKVTFSNGKVAEYPLPEALPKGIVMSVNPLGKDNISVKVQKSENSPADSIIVVAQSRGQINLISKGQIKDKPVQSVMPKKIFPAGIAQITVFKGEGEPVCERLVFINPETEKNISGVKLTSESVNDSIIYNIKVTPSNGVHSSGNLSFSVVENLSDTGVTKENILTDLLLTSDIKGRVNNPSYYFDTTNANAGKYLDLVMLTNGWRRFAWKELLADKFPVINYTRTGGISVSGTIYGDNINLPIPNSTVVLSFLNNSGFNMRTTTDKNGKFWFPVLKYGNFVDVKIETTRSANEAPEHIALDVTPGPGSITNPYPLMYNEVYDKNKLKENTKRDKLERKKLPEFKSTEDNAGQSGTYYNPSFVLKVGENATTYSNIIEYMIGRIPGLIVSGDKIKIRGSKSLLASDEPLFLLNNSQVSLSTILSLPCSEIDRIELVTGANASAFGSRGANGVLVFCTEGTGSFMYTSIVLRMSGYQKTKEFYIPPYQSWTYKPEDYNIPRTIFWKPDIVLSPDGEATISFKNKSGVKKWNTTLEGLTDSGKIIYKNSTN